MKLQRTRLQPLSVQEVSVEQVIAVFCIYSVGRYYASV